MISLILIPHTGQNWCRLPRLALQLGQDIFMLLFKCSMVTVFCSKSTSLILSASASDILHPSRESSLISSLSRCEFATSSINSISVNSRYAFIIRRLYRILDSLLSLEVSSLHGVTANIFSPIQLSEYKCH